jgi:uncharacterized membrane protein HdeD (DUF308 family)
MTSATVSAPQHSWGWILALGILMIVLGIVAMFMIPVTTLAAALVLGWLMLFSGIAEGAHAFKSPALEWRVPAHLMGILGVVL